MCTLKEEFFPDMITNLPEADIPIEGLHSYLLQGENQQFVFMGLENEDRYKAKSDRRGDAKK